MASRQFARDHEQGVLVALQQNQFGRLQVQNLAAQLGPDGAAGPGHQHPLSPYQALDGRLVQVDRVPLEQVLDGEVPDLIDAHLSIQQFAQVGQRGDRHLVGFECADDPAPGCGVRARNRDQNLLRPGLGDDLRQPVPPAEHPNAMDARPSLRLVVINEADRAVPVRRGSLHVTDDPFAGVAGAEHQHGFLALAVAELSGQPAAESQPCK